MTGRPVTHAASHGGSGHRPVIGISAYCEQAKWNQWDQPAVLLPRNYCDQVAAAGGTPVLLPPLPGIEAVIGRLDGLIISGGPDVDPARYGEPAGPRTTVIRPERDAAEVALVTTAIAAGLPVLGICRGMQLINVALGGTLTQHLPDLVGHEGHSPTPGVMAEHEVRIEPAGRLAAILGRETAVVPTYHHQGAARLAPGLIAQAWADDGTIEAFDFSTGDFSTGDFSTGDFSTGDFSTGDFSSGGSGTSRSRFAIAVQWHPEAGADPSLFVALLAAARERALNPVVS